MTDQFPADATGSVSDPSPGRVAVPGALIAGYRLERQIGQGGMAVVFVARDERLRRRVALKLLTPALAADGAFRKRFAKESLAAAAVDDPHIIPIYETGDADGVLFIAMRYVPGGDVRTLLHREGTLTLDRAASIISPVASALDAAHEAGLVHRDVKPANMLIDVRPGRPDHLYLSDFGLSKSALSSVGLTGAGEFLGTPDYCAPEQADGRPVSGQTDQYALACAVFELLTGAPPFQRDLGLAVIYAHMSEPPPLLSQRRPDLPGAADKVLSRALAKTAQNRYPTCREFSDDLRAALGLQPYAPGAALAAGPSRDAAVAATPARTTPVEVAAGQSPGHAFPGAAPAAHAAAPQGEGATDTLPRRIPRQDRLENASPHHNVPTWPGFTGAGDRRDEAAGRAAPPERVTAASRQAAAQAEQRTNADEKAAGPRRLPIIPSALILFALLVSGGLLGGYQYVHSQYYVGTSNGKVAIFRGLDQSVLGISLSSVYQSTDIPVSGLPAPDAQAVSQNSPGSLAAATRLVGNVRHGYQNCQAAYAARQRWLAHKPKPVKIRVKVNGRTVIRTLTPKYRPEPPIPAGCPPAPPSAAQ